MPNLLAMSFEGELAPSFDLKCLHPGKKPPDGWGIGYYPGGEAAAAVLKEPAPPPGSIRSELIKAWEHLESSIFLLHIRTATWGGLSAANTQPFHLPYARRDWMFAHSGSLKARLDPPENARFERVGSTDTELIFCELLGWIADKPNCRSIGDLDLDELRGWFDTFSDYGSMTSVLTDGRDLVVYVDKNGAGEALLATLRPPYDRIAFGDEELSVDLAKRGVKSRKGVIVASNRLEASDGVDGTKLEWRALSPGQLVVVRQGMIVKELGRERSEVSSRPARAASIVTRAHPASRPVKAEVTRYAIYHRTAYAYDNPVERSTHLLRLTPVHDRFQTLLESQLRLSVDGQQREYEDVFGNRVRRVLIETPFTELVIEARSTVEVLDTDPLSARPLHARDTIPLVWMPWQRHMLQPYLLPPELPDTQLLELTEYAMSFVERSDYDLIDTLLDLNASIFKEYEYRQGATSLATTAFEVYVNRHGVCQDFANLFICLARLLGVPARYTCGYVHTGGGFYSNTRQSEASHAWVQVYLPEVGWKGFDPTNGILTQTEHIRVAVGRNYVDATPTSGTLYVGGGRETLSVDVHVDTVPRG
jgi:transglutaminase-like putative cysteine protease/predicted glutamine amidotransferase